MIIAMRIFGSQFADLFEWLDCNYPGWLCENAGYHDRPRGNRIRLLHQLGETNAHFNFYLKIHHSDFQESDRVAIALAWNVAE